MTTIITPVGTSLFTNGARDNNTIGDYYKEIENAPGSDWDSYKSFIDPLRLAAEVFIRSNGVSASAEFQSSVEIQKELDRDITVHLLASDTVASRLAAEILKAQHGVFGPHISIQFNCAQDVIRGLQVENTDTFSKVGIPSLFEWLACIRGDLEEKRELAMNITGGYGATTPLLTVFARLNRFPIYYYFENAKEVIEIQNILASAGVAP